MHTRKVSDGLVADIAQLTIRWEYTITFLFSASITIGRRSIWISSLKLIEIENDLARLLAGPLEAWVSTKLYSHNDPSTIALSC